jgi:nitroreductase
MLDLDQAIRERHSTRLFLPQPVPRELVNEALALAQYAPSNSNIQPWHMVFASGASRDRLVAALIDEAQRRPPNIPPLPASFQHFRSELGAQVYGAMGISREDTARHAAAVLRNWEFFRAPVADIVCMHRDLGPADALSVGMFLQTLLLALTERGLGSCVEVSILGYPKIVRAQLAIPTELSILCGLAIGYPDPEFPAINYTSPASQLGRTWFSSTTNPRKPSLISFVRSYCIARKMWDPNARLRVLVKPDLSS